MGAKKKKKKKKKKHSPDNVKLRNTRQLRSVCRVAGQFRRRDDGAPSAVGPGGKRGLPRCAGRELEGRRERQV
jgi:hypothetical protein